MDGIKDLLCYIKSVLLEFVFETEPDHDRLSKAICDAIDYSEVNFIEQGDWDSSRSDVELVNVEYKRINGGEFNFLEQNSPQQK